MLENIGVYVLGGIVLYFFLVLMNVLLVKFVGVKKIVMVILLRKGGIDLYILVVVDFVGVDEIYMIGGV